MSSQTGEPHYVNAAGRTQGNVAGSTVTSTATGTTDVPHIASATTPVAQANPAGTLRPTAIF